MLVSLDKIYITYRNATHIPVMFGLIGLGQIVQLLADLDKKLEPENVWLMIRTSVLDPMLKSTCVSVSYYN